MTKAFSEELRQRLKQGKYADWSTDLSEDTVETLMWALGEIYIRADENTMKDGLGDFPPVVRARIMEAHRIVRQIFRGRAIGVEEASERIRDAISAAQQEDA